MTADLAVLVTARDEEEQIGAALGTVAGWAAELVVVVDPRTRDRTRELAADAGARVLEHPFAGSGAQCNFGLDRCRHRWVFVLDADERVGGPLRAAVAAAVAAPRHPAYAVRRRNLAFGRPLRFGDWGRDRVVRLVDRFEARYVELSVHGAVNAASVGRLEGELEHHTLRTLEQYLPKVQDYARRGAADLVAAGRRASWAGAVGHGAWRFFRSYVFRLGLLDGGPGLVVAALGAWGTFLKWTAVWEAGATPARSAP